MFKGLLVQTCLWYTLLSLFGNVHLNLKRSSSINVSTRRLHYGDKSWLHQLTADYPAVAGDTIISLPILLSIEFNIESLIIDLEIVCGSTNPLSPGLKLCLILFPECTSEYPGNHGSKSKSAPPISGNNTNR